MSMSKYDILQYIEDIAQQARDGKIELEMFEITQEAQVSPDGRRTKPSGRFTVKIRAFDQEVADRDFYNHDAAVAAAHKAMPEVP